MSNKKLEYEIRIYNIDEEEIKDIILKNGGKLIQEKKIMPFIVFNHPKNKKDYYIRIRDEGYKITMTTKTKLRSKYVVEREIKIDSLDEGCAILEMLGCKIKYKIEKIREIYSLGNSKEIVFDSYAGLPTYMEIECENEEMLKQVAELLGYELKDNDKRGIKDLYYELYGISKKSKWGGNVTIKNAKNIFIPLLKKNEDNFLKILEIQESLI
tara:strand:- start:226 stop:861 length:636 start_codon:yes stop_codon:yes gene_type:complete